MARKALSAPEQKLIQLYRDLSDEHQQEAMIYLEGLVKKGLESIQRKIRAIQENLIASEGLTRKEADIAAKSGLIAEDQKWWWTEEWQAGEREAEADIQAGRVSPPMTVAEMRKYFGDA